MSLHFTATTDTKASCKFGLNTIRFYCILKYIVEVSAGMFVNEEQAVISVTTILKMLVNLNGNFIVKTLLKIQDTTTLVVHINLMDMILSYS